MSKVLVLVLISVFFTACSIKDVSKPLTKYGVSNNQEVQKSSLQVNKILKITKVKSPHYINTTNIWYKKPSFEIGSYLYSHWNEDFSGLVEQSIANTIFESGLFKSTFTRYSKVKSDLVLESEIIEAMQYVEDDAKVSFKIRLFLIDQYSGKLLSSKGFEYIEKCISVDAKGAVIAYNEIIKKLNKDVVLWLSKSVKEN